MTLAHLDHEMYMLGYLARENRVFLIDKQLRITHVATLDNVADIMTKPLPRSLFLKHANTLLE